MRSSRTQPLVLIAAALIVAPQCGTYSTNDTGSDGGRVIAVDGATGPGSLPGDSDGSIPGADDAGPQAPDGGSPHRPDGGPLKAECGDGVIEAGEACDDGNSRPGDGCSATCNAIESGFACPTPGAPCVSTVVCGDDRVTGTETCDDGNAAAGDGCSTHCQLEAGWNCPAPGAKCVAAACGDGIVAGNEACDDGNTRPADGCSAMCRLEDGWACDPGQGCHPTTCGDHVREGTEQCDDGNLVAGDGCSPFCEVEPTCNGTGPCTSACGDGMILPDDVEACDDGNTVAGDGCSPTCAVESGFECNNSASQLSSTLVVPITFRDFIALPTNGATKHPDFETFAGSGTPGLVQNALGSDGKPVYTGRCELGTVTGPTANCPDGAQTTSEAAFDQWYRDVPGVNRTLVTRMTLNRQADGSYYFPDSAFFPLDAKGWVAAGKESSSSGHNFGFTSELRTWFLYRGNETLRFSGDDDVWVFINKTLVIDLGGLHSVKTASVTLDSALAAQIGLHVGSLYEMVLFHAERHSNASNFNLTLSGFSSGRSTCTSDCGDGVVAGDEQCDDGVNDGRYGGCTADCHRAAHCGDGQLQAPEQCDDGFNLTSYSATGHPGCAPGCVFGATCGDGRVDSLFGEECDDSTNQGGYGKCRPDCRLDARCGDGIVQPQFESCDDGNTVSGDGCSSTCKYDGPN